MTKRLLTAWAVALVFPQAFSATGWRTISSKAVPGRTDTAKVQVSRNGPVVRTEVEDADGEVVSVQIADLDGKLLRSLDPRTKTYTETPLASGADAWMDAGFPLGKHRLKKLGKAAGAACTDYAVLPSWGPGDREAWDSARASMTVCLKPGGRPESSVVKTIEKDGRLWKNALTFETFTPGRPKVESAPPADFQKL